MTQYFCVTIIINLSTARNWNVTICWFSPYCIIKNAAGAAQQQSLKTTDELRQAENTHKHKHTLHVYQLQQSHAGDPRQARGQLAAQSCLMITSHTSHEKVRSLRAKRRLHDRFPWKPRLARTTLVFCFQVGLERPPFIHPVALRSPLSPIDADAMYRPTFLLHKLM